MLAGGALFASCKKENPQPVQPIECSICPAAKGTVTLVNGHATVIEPLATENSIIILTPQNQIGYNGGQEVHVLNRNNGNFMIEGHWQDASIIGWVIYN